MNIGKVAAWFAVPPPIIPPPIIPPPTGLIAINWACARFPVANLVGMTALRPAMTVLGVAMMGMLRAPAVPAIAMAPALLGTICCERIVPPVAAMLVGMYVIGMIVGHDWLPACAVTSWMFVSLVAAGFDVAAACSTVGLLSGRATKVLGVLLLMMLLLMLLLVEEAVRRLSPVVGVAALTCTGRLNVCIRSGDCWMGEVAVCAVFCFSRLRHLARLFWNQT